MKLANYLIYLFWFVIAPCSLAQEGDESGSQSPTSIGTESKSAKNPNLKDDVFIKVSAPEEVEIYQVKPVVIRAKTGEVAGVIRLKISKGPEKIGGTIWKDAQATEKLEEDFNVAANTNFDKTVYVKGVVPSDSNKDVAILGVLDFDPISEEGKLGEEDVADTDALTVAFLPMEVAPEVLAVNSDFDEGRIDPDTGYAIPDCDDVPGVDRKTGAGNGRLRIDTERRHLLGLFANDERVTDDMHKGWFGVNPNQLDDDFWDGATVTIRKIDKIDEDTKRKESGQVRFYAKWGDPKFGTYYGIIPYDLQTLAPNNLVTSGVNNRAGEGVYGSTSTIPDDAEFWMEGVRPGKITLEWSYKKGDIEFKHVQTFLVETRQSPIKWKAALSYKIMLDTANDPSGFVFVNVDPRTTAQDYWLRVERMSEYYDYYQENYLANDDFQWCGLARLAGSQVISGVSDARFGQISASPIINKIVGDLIDTMSEGGYDIFDSLAWQHHAYRSSGLGALQWTDDKYDDRDLEVLIDSWRELDDGIHSGNAKSIENAALEMARHEQQDIIVPTWNNLRKITLRKGDITDVFTTLAENVMKPNGDRFTVAVSGGNLSNTVDRWKWIEDTASGSPNGIIGAWKAAGRAGQRVLVSKTLRVDSERFTQVPAFVRNVQFVAPGERGGMQVRDDLDKP